MTTTDAQASSVQATSNRQFPKNVKLFLSEEQHNKLMHAAVDLDISKLPQSVTGGNRNPNASMLIRSLIEQYL